jgi:hypothetical protein
MRRGMILASAVWLALLAFWSRDPSFAYTPTASYQELHLEGFRVLVSPKARQFPAETETALRLLEGKLAEIARLLPAEKVNALRKVAFWVEWDSEPNGAAEYHISADWLRKHGYNPEKAGAIEISNVLNFMLRQQEQPTMVLHELAHGYYYRVMGGDRSADVSRAYENAVRSGLYLSVDHVRGGKKRAYAIINKVEYFAELTEAYFGRNDFYPFVRQELAAYDPAGYGLMGRAWGASREERLAAQHAARPTSSSAN